MINNLTIQYNSLTHYKNIFDNNDDPKKMEQLVWMHEQNLLHKSYYSIFVDEASNTPAALYAVFPVVFKKFNEKITAVQSIDTITDINYRGQGLFKKLAIDCYNNAKADGIEFVYGFPNANSAPGFFKSLGWKPIAEVPFLIKPINLLYPLQYKLKKKFPFQIKLNLGLKWMLGNKAKKYQMAEMPMFNDTYNELWQKYATTFSIGVNRDAAYMNWRISNNPTQKYIVQSFSINNKLVAVFILSIKEEKHQGKIGYVIDTIFDPAYETDVPHLFNAAIKKNFYSAGVDVVLAWCFPHSNNYKQYRANGFYNLPQKLQPIKLFFGANNFNEKNNETFFDKKNWYISYADSDTV